VHPHRGYWRVHGHPDGRDEVGRGAAGAVRQERRREHLPGGRAPVGGRDAHGCTVPADQPPPHPALPGEHQARPRAPRQRPGFPHAG
ncbi:unnamed protein product, partial [Ectocarpus sp. 12 AP-2014]